MSDNAAGYTAPDDTPPAPARRRRRRTHQPSSRRRRRRRNRRIALVVAVLVVVGLGAWLGVSAFSARGDLEQARSSTWSLALVPLGALGAVLVLGGAGAVIAGHRRRDDNA